MILHLLSTTQLKKGSVQKVIPTTQKVIRSAFQIFWPAKMLTELLFELLISAHLNRVDT